MYAKITNDLLNEADPELFGEAHWAVGKILISTVSRPKESKILKVRLLDDDREPYFLAEADDEALEDLFEWAMRDSGCTILQVKNPSGGWTDTIG